MPVTKESTLILHVAVVSNSNLLGLFEFLLLPIHFNFPSNILVTPDVGATNLLAIGLTKSFPPLTCIHASTSGTLSFAKEGR